MSTQFKAFLHACENGHDKTVNTILQQGQDPSENMDEALCLATRYGHVAIVQRLLQEPSVNAAACMNLPIAVACVYGHMATAKLLMKFPHVDPSAGSNMSIVEAALQGDVAMVDLLLADSRVDPSVRGNLALAHAMEQGHCAVSLRLLQDLRVDPAMNDNEPLIVACSWGDSAMLQHLLRDPRVDPCARNCYAVSLAKFGTRECLDMLMTDSRVFWIVATRDERKRKFAYLRKVRPELMQQIRDLHKPEN